MFKTAGVAVADDAIDHGVPDRFGRVPVQGVVTPEIQLDGEPQEIVLDLAPQLPPCGTEGSRRRLVGPSQTRAYGRAASFMHAHG